MMMCCQDHFDLCWPFSGFSRERVLRSALPFPSSRGNLGTVQLAQGHPGWLFLSGGTEGGSNSQLTQSRESSWKWVYLVAQTDKALPHQWDLDLRPPDRSEVSDLTEPSLNSGNIKGCAFPCSGWSPFIDSFITYTTKTDHWGATCQSVAASE